MKLSNKNNLSSKRGFTLLELLVAIAIFSVLSVMAYAGLDTVITTKKSTQQASDRIAEIQLVMMRITNDLRQAVPRKVRDEYGSFIHAMELSKTDGTSMEWSRGGYRNPARLTRSHVQRVAYKLEQQKLTRVTWPVLDRAQDTESIQSVVLSDIESMEWRFLNNENEWVSAWPEEEEKAELYPLPKAVEFNVEIKSFGKIRRLILVANNI